MLTFNFTRIFKARGIDKPFSYLVKVGYSDNFATRIVNNRIKSNKTVVDDYGYEKTVYESYQTVYNVGGKEYNLKSFNK